MSSIARSSAATFMPRVSRRARGRLRQRGEATRSERRDERRARETNERGEEIPIVDDDDNAAMLLGEYFTDGMPRELAHASLEV